MTDQSQTTDPWRIPIEKVPPGWRIVNVLQAAGGAEWWGPTLHAAVERACWEAVQ